MVNLFDISPFVYSQVYYWTSFIICLMMFFRYSASSDNKLLLQQNTFVSSLLLSVVAILFLGLRPVHYRFGDMYVYAKGYQYFTAIGQVIDSKGEWAFATLQQICIDLGLSVNIFFLICTIGYIGFQYWACRKLLWENSWLAMLFILSAFEFYEFAVNGVRNGLACALVMFSMSVAITSNKNKLLLLIAAGIAFLAFGTHKSTAIPIACALLAFFFIRKTKYALWIWLFSIPASLVAGGSFANYVAGSMDEARSSFYKVGAETEATFSQTGFRWDFLLYSAVPVFLIWYVTQKRKINDSVFNFLSITYLLANSFWILVIQAPFSNRYAYLSWFLYPLVLAYALIRLHIWEDQDRRIGFYLLLHAAFTLLMYILGKL